MKIFVHFKMSKALPGINQALPGITKELIFILQIYEKSNIIMMSMYVYIQKLLNPIKDQIYNFDNIQDLEGDNK